MKTKKQAHFIFLLIFILSPFVFVTSLSEMAPPKNIGLNHINNINIDLNGELDKKLTELFSYYKGIIKEDKKDHHVTKVNLVGKQSSIVNNKSNYISENKYDINSQVKEILKEGNSNYHINKPDKKKNDIGSNLLDKNLEQIEEQLNPKKAILNEINKKHFINNEKDHQEEYEYHLDDDKEIDKKEKIIVKKEVVIDKKQKLNLTLSSIASLSNLIKKEEEISFIQNSLKLGSPQDSKSALFSYQPFVWTEFKTLKKSPNSRRGHSSVLADTYMIVFGGCYMETKCFNDLFFLDLRTQNWIEMKTKGTIPSPRQGHSAVLYGSTMWIYGGSSSEGYLNDLYSLNLETREWKKHYFTSAAGKGRAGHGAVLDDHAKIIIFGGYSEGGYLNDLFVVNILEERFEFPLASGKGPTPRENFSMVKINSRIFLFGGFQEGGVLNDFFSLDLITWTWTKVKTQGPVPPARQGMASTRVGKKIFVTGGCDYRKNKCYTDTFYIDTDSLWWTKVENNKSDLSGRGDFTITFFRGSIYSFGGCEMYKRCFNTVFILNVSDMCPNKCSGHGTCKEVIGCVCKKGYTSHDCSEKVKCKEDCNTNGICHTNARCGCYAGWSGVVCRTLIPCPRNCTDSNSGVCQPDTTCKCKPGFAGKDCSVLTIVGNSTAASSDPFKALTALSASKIKIDPNKLKEEIKEKKQASSNKKKKKILCPNGCNGNGRCDFSNGKCTCENNFTGDDCNMKVRKAEVLKRQAKDGSDDDSNNSSDDDSKSSASGKLSNDSAKSTQDKDSDSTKSSKDASSDSTKSSKDASSDSTKSSTDASSDSGSDSSSDSSASEAAATEKQKLEIKNLKLYKMGDSGEIYYQTTDCMNNCTKRGLCLNSTCFCEQGYSSDDCAMTYKQYLEQGIKFSDVSGILIGAFGLAFLVTMIVMIIKKANKVTNDHIEFEES